MPTLETANVTSADGTRVCYRTLGDGPPLVISHGAFATSDDYVPVAVRLATTHRVVLVDRRGYRGSDLGPGPGTFAQDAEDLVAVMAPLGGPAPLFGHSAGAIAALHLARRAPELVTALALFEPPILFGGPDRLPLLERYRELRAGGDDAGALMAFAAATSAVPDEVVRLWVDAPALSPRIAAVAAGLGRDLESMVALAPELGPWRALGLPVALLRGTAGRYDALDESVAGLAEILPGSRTLALPGQDHLAEVLDPDLLAAAIRAALVVD